MSFRNYLRTVKQQLRKAQALGIPIVRPEIIATIPHDTKAFTQGLFLHEDKLYESTGLKGKSSLRVVDKKSGKLEQIIPVESVFAEGIARLNSRIYQLTWTARIVLVYDFQSLEMIDTLCNINNGWGLTSDGEYLIVSNGSSVIEFRNECFELVKSIKIRMNGLPLRLINDLAFFRGSCILMCTGISESMKQTLKLVEYYVFSTWAILLNKNTIPCPF